MKQKITYKLKNIKLLMIMALLIMSSQLSIAQCNSFLQQGSNIPGMSNFDLTGISVSLSADGSIVAVGSVQGDILGVNHGNVKVYKNIAGAWIKQGADIIGEAAKDFSGWSVSLSADGTTVAVGATQNAANGVGSGHVKVLKFISGVWTKLGNDIYGDTAGNYMGASVSLSADGLILAVGAPGNAGGGSKRGLVRVYKFLSNTWVQQGDDLNGEANNNEIGNAVSLSNDGLTIAIGSQKNQGGGLGRGHVRIFKFDSGSWTQVGNNINGKADLDRSGHSVSLSADGLTVAIGGPFSNIGGTVDAKGQVRVYKLISGTWTQQGDDINGENYEDYFGHSVSLSSDGLTLAIGATGYDGSGHNRGLVRIYKFTSGTWTQQGGDINGEADQDDAGYSVSLSADGSIVAIGSPYSDISGSRRGHARVFKCSENTNVIQPSIANITIYPNPFNETLNLDLDINDGESAVITITDILGKTVFNQTVNNNPTLDLNSLNAGVYFLQVQIGTTTKTYKVIKQ